MTTLDESTLNYSAINEINSIIDKKQSEIESLTRVRDDLLRALKEDFIMVSDDNFKIDKIGILMGTSSKYLGKIKILNVLPESFASNSGIVKGDIIKKINNSSTADLSMSNVKTLISDCLNNDNLTITIQRNSQIFDVKIK